MNDGTMVLHGSKVAAIWVHAGAVVARFSAACMHLAARHVAPRAAAGSTVFEDDSC